MLPAFLAAMITVGANAQGRFDEMTYDKTKTVFRLNAPSLPKVRIYKNGQGGRPVKTVKMRAIGDNRWEATVKGDLGGMFYTFDIGRGECPGTFAKAVGVNGSRGAIINMADTDPVGWADDQRPPLASPADLVIYELHMRDFSISPTSGLQHRGKYLALTEPRAIDYLKRLGVNAIHFQPLFDFASIDETQLYRPQFNWGYDPKNYNVPEGSYSTDPYQPGVRIREFKAMVQALHKAGIRVIFDAVYNHTFDIAGSNFQLTYPNYYYRKTADGRYSDGSGCGNETASERPLMREFMIESVKYWVNEFHIDGFRFDLMGIHDIETMNQIRAAVDQIDPTLYIYGEGWSAGACAYPQDRLAMKANTHRLNGIGAFSDDMRDALRGPFSDDTKGAFLAGLPGNEESIKAGIAGMIAHPQVDYTKVNYSKEPWAEQPTQMISYVSCHDDMCLVDRLKASIPGIQEDELIRLDQLAQTAVFLSQGVPFMLSGEELMRDKKGVHNSFNSPDSINQFNWNGKLLHPQIYNYYKNLIQLRKNHPAFRLGKACCVRKHLEFLPSQDALVAFRLKDLGDKDTWQNIIVILNGSKEPREVCIPEGEYTIVACDGVINEEGLGTVSGSTVTVDPQTALIIHN